MVMQGLGWIRLGPGSWMDFCGSLFRLLGVVVYATREKWEAQCGMILDAVCGGSLLTIAVALHQPPARAALSQMGFGAAAWVAFVSASALVLARSVQRHEGQSQQQ